MPIAALWVPILKMINNCILYISFKHNVIDGIIQRQVGSLQRQVAFFFRFIQIITDFYRFLGTQGSNNNP